MPTVSTTVYMALTLDGFIAKTDGDVSFLADYPPQEGDDFGFESFLDSVDVIVMGRRSFEKVVSMGEWIYRDIPVVVWTRSAATKPLQLPAFLQDKKIQTSDLSPKDLVQQLSTQYKHVYVDGGLTVRAFLKEGLIDRLVLTRVPLILGSGIPLLDSSLPTIPLDHIGTKSFRNGLIMSTYRVKKEG